MFSETMGNEKWSDGRRFFEQFLLFVPKYSINAIVIFPHASPFKYVKPR